jgi:hypothetical protein
VGTRIGVVPGDPAVAFVERPDLPGDKYAINRAAEGAMERRVRRPYGSGEALSATPPTAQPVH